MGPVPPVSGAHYPDSAPAVAGRPGGGAAR